MAFQHLQGLSGIPAPGWTNLKMLEIDAGRFINLSTGDSADTDHTDDAPDPRAPGLSGCPELLSRLPRCAEDRTHIPA